MVDFIRSENIKVAKLIIKLLKTLSRKSTTHHYQREKETSGK